MIPHKYSVGLGFGAASFPYCCLLFPSLQGGRCVPIVTSLLVGLVSFLFVSVNGVIVLVSLVWRI